MRTGKDFDVSLKTFYNKMHDSLERNVGPREQELPFTITMFQKLEAVAACPAHWLTLRTCILAFFAIARADEPRGATIKFEENDRMLWRVEGSKTDTKHEGAECRFKCCCQNTAGLFKEIRFCPVHVLKPDEITIMQKTATATLRNRLYKLLERAKIQNHVPDRKRVLYGLNSCRLGGNQAAVVGGLDRELVKKIGRWDSDVNLHYEKRMRCSHTQILFQLNGHWPILTSLSCKSCKIEMLGNPR